MPAKFSWIAVIIFFALVFSWSVYRDIHLEKRYAGDLRNRVVGARLQKDGRSPYFYKWKQGDGTRYYDPNNFDSLRVANITASPFFHYLMYPVAELPQRTISVIWLIGQYIVLTLIVALSLSLATTTQQRWCVIIAAALLLLTEAWKMHIGNGQNYSGLVLLAMLFYYCMRKKTLVMCLLAGICVAMLVLIKPTLVLFFVPFLFLLRMYSRQQLAVLLLPMAAACIWIGCSTHQMHLWKDYKQNITQQILLHQQESPEKQVNDPDPVFEVWEGIDPAAIQQAGKLFPDKIYSENGNFFVLTQQLFHIKINTTVLSFLSAACIVLLLLVFYLRHRDSGFTLPATALAGYCLFMTTDLFSPVYRHQYYAVLWLFPLMLGASLYQESLKKIYVVIAVGLLLNITNIPFLPMEHTMGEYIMLGGFIVLSLRRKTQGI